jgi:hypothetical protein
MSAPSGATWFNFLGLRFGDDMDKNLIRQKEHVPAQHEFRPSYSGTELCQGLLVLREKPVPVECLEGLVQVVIVFHYMER